MGGPGEQTTGGGLLGGGFGLEEAVAGILIASPHNMLTTRASIDTVLGLRTRCAEIFLHHDEATPTELRMPLSPVFTRLRQLQEEHEQAGATSEVSPPDPVEQLARLARLRVDGLSTDDEFTAFRAMLMGTHDRRQIRAEHRSGRAKNRSRGRRLLPGRSRTWLTRRGHGSHPMESHTHIGWLRGIVEVAAMPGGTPRGRTLLEAARRVTG